MRQLSRPSLDPVALLELGARLRALRSEGILVLGSGFKANSVDVAHPASDNYVPLLLTLGAASDPSIADSSIDRMVLGNSIRSVQMT